MDTIILGDDTGTSTVDLRFTNAVTWLRVYNDGAAFNAHFVFFESSAIIPNEVAG
jgi:hypothetical protein